MTENAETGFPRPGAKHGPLAQSVEQLAFNQLVAGSNPARPTIFDKFPVIAQVFLTPMSDSGVRTCD
jgi:hypothetical protein